MYKREKIQEGREWEGVREGRIVCVCRASGV